MTGAEACDDNNTTAGDGCSATCTVETGYACAGMPSVCTATCGDGMVLGAEGCDDNNTTAGDGCSATCTVEPGYTCTGMPSVCTAAASGEDCSSAIAIASGATVMNSTLDAGNDFRFTDGAGCQGASSVTSATAGDLVYRIQVPANSRLNADLTTTWDSTFNLIGGATNCGMNVPDAGTQGVACVAGRDDPNDQSLTWGNAGSSAVDVFLLIDGWGANSGPFALTTNVVALQAGDMCDNATPLTAGTALMGESTATSANDYFGSGTGCSSTSSEADNAYSISVPGGQRLSVTVTPATGFNTSISFATSVANCGTRTCATSGSSGGAGVADNLTWTNMGSTAQTIYVIVDSDNAAGGTYSIVADLQTPSAGDICSSATALTAGTPLTMQTTQGYSNDYSGSGTGALCSASAGGPDRIFSLAVPNGQRATFAVSPDAGFDPSLSLAADLTTCGNRTCLAGTNAAGTGAVETLAFNNNSGSAQTWYLVVDSTSTAGGNFDVSAALDSTPSGDLCDSATALTAGTPLTMQTTAGFTNDYFASGTNCSSASGGPDRAYSVSVPNGNELTVVVSPDAGYNSSITLIGSPASNCGMTTGRTCLANNNSGSAGAADTVRWLNISGSSQTVYAVVDSTSGAGNFDISATVAAAQPGEVCELAGAPITANTTLASETLAGYAGNYIWGGGGGCVSGTGGPDRSYAVTIPVGQRIRATVMPASSWNPTLHLTADCNAASVTCVASSNSGAANGATDVLTYTNPGTTPLTLFLVVDTAATAPTTYSLDIVFETPPPPPAGETCQMPTVINMSGTLTGETTVGYNNDVGTVSGAAECTGYSNSGPDKVYQVTVPAGQTLTATATPTAWDNALYLVASPASNCLVSGTTQCVNSTLGDSGGLGDAESVTYTNATASPVTLFIVVDGYISGNSGVYDLTVSLM